VEPDFASAANVSFDGCIEAAQAVAGGRLWAVPYVGISGRARATAALPQVGTEPAMTDAAARTNSRKCFPTEACAPVIGQCHTVHPVPGPG